MHPGHDPAPAPQQILYASMLQPMPEVPAMSEIVEDTAPERIPRSGSECSLPSSRAGGAEQAWEGMRRNVSEGSLHKRGITFSQDTKQDGAQGRLQNSGGVRVWESEGKCAQWGM